jgi:hypothetical protein
MRIRGILPPFAGFFLTLAGEPHAKFFGMMFSRRILVRLVVAVLAISLTSPLLEGQAMRCAQMTASMVEGHAQHGHDAMTSGSHDKKSQRTPQSSSCLIGAICLNAPAILVSAPVSFDAAPVPVEIVYGAITPDAQSPRPDSPPPKI